MANKAKGYEQLNQFELLIAIPLSRVRQKTLSNFSLHGNEFISS